MSHEYVLLVDFYEKCNSLGYNIPYILNIQNKLMHKMIDRHLNIIYGYLMSCLN